jgi:hypothetical protein
MNIETEVTPIRSPSTPAERMRLYRRRQACQRRVVRIEINAAEIDDLVKRGYLGPEAREDWNAIERAANAFFSDAFCDA